MCTTGRYLVNAIYPLDLGLFFCAYNFPICVLLTALMSQIFNTKPYAVYTVFGIGFREDLLVILYFLNVTSCQILSSDNQDKLNPVPELKG